MWHYVGTTLALEGDATFECFVRSHVEDHNSRLHAGGVLILAAMNLLGSDDAAAKGEKQASQLDGVIRDELS
jgi:hypothetical protein